MGLSRDIQNMAVALQGVQCQVQLCCKLADALHIKCIQMLRHNCYTKSRHVTWLVAPAEYMDEMHAVLPKLV